MSRDWQVFVGGVSDGRLQRGDVITAIQHHDAARIPHRQAEDIIRTAGDTLSLSIRRSVRSIVIVKFEILIIKFKKVQKMIKK